ncbi:MAG: hypothetical protein V4726_15195 [Verrucomicrobiota bacterium]
MNPEIESLMNQYLDGRVTPEEAAALAEILSRDPEAAARFAELTRMDEGLRVALKAESRSALFASRLKSNAESAAAATSAKRPADRRRWLAAAAGLAVLGGTAWWFSRDGAVPAVVMEWAKSRVKRSGDDGGSPGAPADALRVDRPVDQAAGLRRKLRGFAIPQLHLRSMAVSDALNTLNRQWTDLPHKDPADARDVKIGLAASARKLWPKREQEPVVTVDIPGISLHTALSLVAAQAGLRMEVTADSVSLKPEPPAEEKKGEAGDKTWTFPLAKATADTFLASISPKRDGVPVKEWASKEAYEKGMQADRWVGKVFATGGGGQSRSQILQADEFIFGKEVVQAGGIVVSPQPVEPVPAARLTGGAAEYGFSYSAQVDGGAPAPVISEVGVAMNDGTQLSFVAVDSAGAGAVVLGEPVTENPQSPATQPGGAQSVEITSRFVNENDKNDFLLVQNGGGQTADVKVLNGFPQGASADQYGANISTFAPAADKSVNVTVTMLNAEQRNLNELGYNWLLGPTRTGAQGPPQNGVISGQETAGHTRRIWGEAEMPDTLSYRITNPSGPQPEPWYFKMAGATQIGVGVPEVPATLPAWLASFGVSGESVSHDAENGVLSVTGGPAALRVASAAVAALTESAQSGVSVEMRVVDLGDLPKPDLNPEKGPGRMDPAEVDALCKKADSHPGSACVRLPVAPGALSLTMNFKIENGRTQTLARLRGSSDDSFQRKVPGDASAVPGMALDASVTPEKRGERWTVNLELKDGNSKSEMNSRFDLMEGSWQVSEGATPGRLYLFRLRSAAVIQ